MDCMFSLYTLCSRTKAMVDIWLQAKSSSRTRISCYESPLLHSNIYLSLSPLNNIVHLRKHLLAAV
ncbi:MAG: hypothetical protein CLLPBCKN_004232 [Chroococcidiopsis cubana SAG 39.79]|nr:hypothetical protein [Chroococcidiopsis cubana SAG 39.79]